MKMHSVLLWVSLLSSASAQQYTISTVAGIGRLPFSGGGSPAVSAVPVQPRFVAVDSAGEYLRERLPYVLPPGAIPGLPSRQVKPGETTVLYLVGFGPVTPNIPAGQIVTQSNQLSVPLTGCRSW